MPLLQVTGDLCGALWLNRRQGVAECPYTWGSVDGIYSESRYQRRGSVVSAVRTAGTLIAEYSFRILNSILNVMDNVMGKSI